MKSLPILLKNPRILLIGAGTVALQKARVLQRNRIDFEVISKEFEENFDEIKSKKTIKSFELKDLLSFKIIIDATGNKSVLEVLLNTKKTKDFLLNVVDVPKFCDFYFSSLLEYGKLKIAISSDGSSPSVTQVVRDKIKKMIPAELENLCENEAVKD